MSAFDTLTHPNKQELLDIFGESPRTLKRLEEDKKIAPGNLFHVRNNFVPKSNFDSPKKLPPFNKTVGLGTGLKKIASTPKFYRNDKFQKFSDGSKSTDKFWMTQSQSINKSMAVTHHRTSTGFFQLKKNNPSKQLNSTSSLINAVGQTQANNNIETKESHARTISDILSVNHADDWKSKKVLHKNIETSTVMEKMSGAADGNNQGVGDFLQFYSKSQNMKNKGPASLTGDNYRAPKLNNGMVDLILRRTDSFDGVSNSEKVCCGVDPENLKVHRRTCSSMVMMTENFNQELLENIITRKVESVPRAPVSNSVDRKTISRLDTSTNIRMFGTEVIGNFNV